MESVSTILLVIGGIAFACGVLITIAGPRVGGEVAELTSRPELGRRASGPDRMRTLIQSQQRERSRRTLLGRRLRVAGGAMMLIGFVSFGAGSMLRMYG